MYYFGLMLSLSAIYMLAGAGAAYSLKAGRINLAGVYGREPYASVRRFVQVKPGFLLSCFLFII